MGLSITQLGQQFTSSAPAATIVQARGLAAQIAALPGFAAKLNTLDARLWSVPVIQRTDNWFAARDAVDAAKSQLDTASGILLRGIEYASSAGYIEGDAGLEGWATTVAIGVGIVALCIGLVFLLPAIAAASAFAAAVAALIAALGTATGLVVVAVGALQSVAPEAAPIVAGGLGLIAIAGIALLAFGLVGKSTRRSS